VPSCLSSVVAVTTSTTPSGCQSLSFGDVRHLDPQTKISINNGEVTFTKPPSLLPQTTTDAQDHPTNTQANSVDAHDAQDETVNAHSDTTDTGDLKNDTGNAQDDMGDTGINSDFETQMQLLNNQESKIVSQCNIING